MIGWRPYLLTFLALAIAATVVLDVTAAGRKASTCSPADGLVMARDYADARTAYAAVLQSDSSSHCATVGVAQAEYGLCVRDQRIGATDADEAHAQLIALAEAEPPPGPKSCVWKELGRLAAESAGKGKT